jgi:hypothetical protein
MDFALGVPGSGQGWRNRGLEARTTLEPRRPTSSRFCGRQSGMGQTPLLRSQRKRVAEPGRGRLDAASKTGDQEGQGGPPFRVSLMALQLALRRGRSTLIQLTAVPVRIKKHVGNRVGIRTWSAERQRAGRNKLCLFPGRRREYSVLFLGLALLTSYIIVAAASKCRRRLSSACAFTSFQMEMAGRRDAKSKSSSHQATSCFVCQQSLLLWVHPGTGIRREGSSPPGGQ